MCVAMPGLIVSVEQVVESSMIAQVAFGSETIREVELAMVPDAQVGDYVIVHSGYAVKVIPADSAVTSLDLFRQMGNNVLVRQDAGEQNRRRNDNGEVT